MGWVFALGQFVSGSSGGLLALIVLIPIVLIGRLVIVKAVPEDELGPTSKRPIGRMMLIPIGAVMP